MKQHTLIFNPLKNSRDKNISITEEKEKLGYKSVSILAFWAAQIDKNLHQVSQKKLAIRYYAGEVRPLDCELLGRSNDGTSGICESRNKWPELQLIVASKTQSIPVTKYNSY